MRKESTSTGKLTWCERLEVWLLEKCHISRNVIFQENPVYKDMIQKENQKQENKNELLELLFNIELGETSDNT